MKRLFSLLFRLYAGKSGWSETVVFLIREQWMSDPQHNHLSPQILGGNIIQISKTIMSEESPQEQTGSAAGDFGGGIQEPMIAEEFWLAMARNNRASAEEIVTWLEVPPVVDSPYLFKMIENKEGKVADLEARQQ